MYLLSYVLASRSSDVSSQFRRLQPDQLQLGAALGQRGWWDRRGRIPKDRAVRGKGADFYANICETLRHGGTTHTRGMNTRRRRKFRFYPPPSVRRVGGMVGARS